MFSEELAERDSLPPLHSVCFASITLISEVGSEATEDCFEMTNILITAWEEEYLCVCCCVVNVLVTLIFSSF